MRSPRPSAAAHHDTTVRHLRPQAPRTRSFVATTAGILIAMFVMMFTEILGHVVFPLPQGLTPADTARLARHADTAPTGALLMVVVGWILGPLMGGFAAWRIHPKLPGPVLTGLLFHGAGVAQVLSVPHPWWMIVAGCTVFLPSALWGARIAGWGEAPQSATPSEIPPS